MSYILEALKKSQQERDAIAAEHPPVFSQAINQNKSSKLTVLLLALFVSVVLLAVLLFFTLKTTSNNTEQVINIEPSQIDRKSTRLNSSHVRISYAVFCLKKKKNL